MIRKLGTIDLDMVETTPIVFNGHLYRLENVRGGKHAYWNNPSGQSYLRFIDCQTHEPGPAFGHGYAFANVLVDGDTVYVSATTGWGGASVDIFASRDLRAGADRLPGSPDRTKPSSLDISPHRQQGTCGPPWCVWGWRSPQKRVARLPRVQGNKGAAILRVCGARR